MISFRNFMVLCLVFHLLSHFDFIFIYGVRVSSTFIGLRVAVQLSQVVPNGPKTTCWRSCLFPIIYSCFLYWRLIDHRYVGLFLGSLFYFIDPYVCFSPNIIVFWLICGVIWSLGRDMPPALFFFLRLALEILGLLWFHINFRIICSGSVKNVLGESW